MHISNARIHKVFELHLHKVGASQIRLSDPVETPDKLTLSGRAGEIQAVRTTILGLNDVRNDKVRAVGQMIRKDLYQPSDYDIASAIIAGAGGRG